MSTKSFVAFTLAGTLALAPLTGCGSQQSESQTSDDQTAEQVEAPTTDDADTPDDANPEMAGGWTVNNEATDMLTDEERGLFEQAMEGSDNTDYAPIAVIATQLVSGTNYAYLCQTEAASANGWAVVTVYQDLEGNASITETEDIELGDIDILEADDKDDDMVGAWEVHELADDVELPADAAQAFSAAAEGYVGVELHPIALLGTQLVSGTNYLVLCEGAPAVQDPKPTLYVAQVYEDLDGNAEFTGVSEFDLLEYV